MEMRLMATRVAAAIDAALYGSAWYRVDTFAESRRRTVQTTRLGADCETITGRETGVHTRLASVHGETLSVVASGSLRHALEGSLDQLDRLYVTHRACNRMMTSCSRAERTLESSEDAGSELSLIEDGLTDFAETVDHALDGLAGVLTFSELDRAIATDDGRNCVEDRQVHRRLHLQLSTHAGGMGEDGIVLQDPGDLSDPSVTGPLLARAHHRAVYSDHRVPSPDGRLPAVFSGAATGVLIHELVGHLLEADIIASGGTVLADRLGSYVCKMPLTIFSDPTLSGRWGSFTYDDEGHFASPTPLLVDGVVCGVLTDRTRGPVAAATYSGHSARRASFQHAPLPRMSNVSMSVGTDRLEDVVSDLDNAIYCDEVTRGQVDPITGHFTLNMISGRLIRSGRLCEYLGPAILAGDVLEVLSSIRAVCDDSDDIQTLCGKEGQQVLVEMDAPSMLVGVLEIRRS